MGTFSSSVLQSILVLLFAATPSYAGASKIQVGRESVAYSSANPVLPTVIPVEIDHLGAHSIAPLTTSSIPAPIAGAPPVTIVSPASSAASDCIIIMDSSQCMGRFPRGLNYSKMTITQWAVYDVLDAIPDDLPTALMIMQNEVNLVRSLEPLTWKDKILLRRLLMRQRPFGNSPLAAALRRANELLERKQGCYANIVVVTDGEECSVGDAHAEAAKLASRYRINFQVVGVAPSPLARRQLQSLAASGNGSFHLAMSLNDLPVALQEVSTPLQLRRETQLAQHAACDTDLQECDLERTQLMVTIGEITVDRDIVISKLADRDRQLAVLRKELGCCREDKHRLETELHRARHELTHCEEEKSNLTAQLDECRLRWTPIVGQFWGLDKVDLAARKTPSGLARPRS